jgi:Tol biopolymer transport system component
MSGTVSGRDGDGRRSSGEELGSVGGQLHVSRRGFLVGAGGVAAALVAGGALARQLGVDAANAADGTSGTLSLTEGSMIQLTVSPDHSTIIMNLLGMLWTLPASGGTATKITGLDTDPAYPDWSPSGDSLAFQSYMGGTYHIWTMKPDGSQLRQLTSGGWDDREPVYSPDGRQIAFSSDRGGGQYNIWILNVGSGQVRRLTNAAAGVSNYYPTWSPDGTEVAYVESAAGAQLIKAVAASGQGVPRVLYGHTSGTIYSPTWSPDGASIAYVLQGGAPPNEHHPNRPALPQLMVNGAPLTSKEDVFVFPPQWLGADTLLYAADGKIRKRGVTGNRVHKVAFTAAVSFNRPSYQKREYDFENQDGQAVKGIANPVLSPDGATVAFVALNQLWTMKIGRTPVKVTDDVYYKATPFWSPDGRSLAYSSDKNGPEAIYIRDVATGKERRLTGPFDGSQVRGAWSPDGTKISFLSITTGSGNAATYVADVATGKTRQVLTPLFEPGRPSWGPDSNVLALASWQQYSNRYREGQSLILTVDITTGEQKLHNPYPWNSISNRKGDEGPVWSPDGKLMAYVLDGVPWVLPVDSRGRPTGEQRQVTEENADAVSWSGDSRTLLYLSNGVLRQVAIPGGRPKTVPLDLTWRRDRPTGVQVIHAGAVWDGVSKHLRNNVDIVVEGNRIARVVEHQPRESYGAGATFVDASDLTVMPGLIESHGHEQMDQPYVGGRKGRFMLAMGVTTVMGMGDPAYEALEQSESELSGARLTPRYFWAAESIDGERVNYDFMRVTANEASLNRQLERIKALRPNILKTYVRLRNDWQAKAIQAGHEIGIPSFSHYVWPAMAHGQDSCSHYATQRLGYQLPVSASNKAYDDTVQLHGRSGMAVELTRGEPSMVGTYRGIMDDQRTRKLLNPWQYKAMQGNYDSQLTPAAEASTKQFINNHARILRAGGTVLGGTDEPLGLNVWALQPTIAGFVKWGFTPYEALRTVTALPAKVLGLESDLGTVQGGRLADLNIVRGNPLQDVHNAANVEMVMKNGRLYTVEELIGPYADVDLNG